MKRWVILLLVIFLILIYINVISASCSENQIDINSASAEELDKLIGIGPAKARAIIDTRPFNSVDDLLDVYGIGEVTLEKIKSQGLACVGNEEENNAEDNKEEVNTDETVPLGVPPGGASTSSRPQNNELRGKKEVIQENNNIQEVEVIKLSAPAEKDIKTENENEGISKNKLAIYGLVGFCILLGFLFLMRRKKYKNEFE